VSAEAAADGMRPAAAPAVKLDAIVPPRRARVADGFAVRCCRQSKGCPSKYCEHIDGQFPLSRNRYSARNQLSALRWNAANNQYATSILIVGGIWASEGPMVY